MQNKNIRPCRGNPPHGYFALKPGTIVRVKPCWGGYPLPSGLSEGDDVQILSFDHGCYWVIKDGQKFHLNQTNVVD